MFFFHVLLITAILTSQESFAVEDLSTYEVIGPANAVVLKGSPDAPSGDWVSILEENHQVWQQDLKYTRKFLNQIVKATKEDPTKIIWAGFSMGAALLAQWP